MAAIHLEAWLYGPMARYAGEASQGSYARLDVGISEGSTVGDLVRQLGILAEERGVAFVNGSLAALPGLEADLDVLLCNGDRVGIFHHKSIWPFQYRFGAQLTPELQETFRQRRDRGIHHAYTQSDE